MMERPLPDPRTHDLEVAQDVDPASGASDDPRVDPTPDRRQAVDVEDDPA